MTKIVTKIKNCKECKHFKTGNHFSSDSWDRMEDWICTLENKKIQGGVEWHEEEKIKIPEWCPISIDSLINEIESKIKILQDKIDKEEAYYRADPMEREIPDDAPINKLRVYQDVLTKLQKLYEN